MEDRKRALVSRLLQYAIVHEVLGLPYEEIIIKRTFEGKPYLVINIVNYFMFTIVLSSLFWVIFEI